MNSQFSTNIAPQRLLRRMRRNRATPAVRALVQETKLHREDFIQPLFVHGGAGGAEEISSMPGVVRHSLSSLLEECQRLSDLGLSAVALFPCIDPSQKEPGASHALSSENILYKAIREIKAALPHLVVIADVALDPYTSHGHDGLLNVHGRVDNDSTVSMLASLAVMQAEAGADIVAPSDMMDGRVRALREALDAAALEQVAIMAYSAKYASAYYGPFREAVGSKNLPSYSTEAAKDYVAPVLAPSSIVHTLSCCAPSTPYPSSASASLKAGSQMKELDKRDYQMDPANLREALLEVKLDEEEGADMVMVKPAGPYLDVIRAVRESTLLPVVAYQVSGEYAQICAAARLGWLDYEATRDEALLSIKRAGATMILSYFSGEVLKSFLD